MVQRVLDGLAAMFDGCIPVPLASSTPNTLRMRWSCGLEVTVSSPEDISFTEWASLHREAHNHDKESSSD